MKIRITDDEGALFSEHNFKDEKLKTFCRELEKGTASKSQKALAFLDLVEEIGQNITSSVNKYIDKLMGWS
jgi:hypothetical protein